MNIERLDIGDVTVLRLRGDINEAGMGALRLMPLSALGAESVQEQVRYLECNADR